LLLTDVAGIYRDFEDKSSLIDELEAREADRSSAKAQCQRA
jgi:acetylglutamate kinase